MKLDAALKRYSRTQLLERPTPIQRLKRIEEALGTNVRVFVKRDDHMELGGGGNKLRKLEFHLGAALESGVDTVLTVGGIQSNHARLTAAACAKLGLGCELFLSRVVPLTDDDYERSGNVLLDALFGARVCVVPEGVSGLDAALKRATDLRARGQVVQVIPSGGSTSLGALGYARCALEIAEQEAALGEVFQEVVVPNGSSGTHAGLTAGFVVLGREARMVRSYSVLADVASTAETTLLLTRETLALLDSSAQLDASDINVDGAFRGAGYGIPTDEMVDAVRLLAQHEGLLIDPVYSGKAFAGLLAELRLGRHNADHSVLFIMTGGTPGLFSYRRTFE